jgi:uncharacterized membrane protein
VRPSNELDDAKETGHIEAFSDGVYAIAITLLVLELKVPHDLVGGPSLVDVLVRQWPADLAFLVSFATIGIGWVNHHRLFTMIRRSDDRLILWNLVLLLLVTVVPFPTALLAEYWQTTEAMTVTLLYNALNLGLAVAFNLLWRHAAGNGGRLLDRGVDLKLVQGLTRQYRFGPLLYLASSALAWWSPSLSLAAVGVFAIFFALPPLVVRKTP